MKHPTHAPLSPVEPPKFDKDCEKWNEWRLLAVELEELHDWLRNTKRLGSIKRVSVWFTGNPRNFYATVSGCDKVQKYSKTCHGSLALNTVNKWRDRWDSIPWSVSKL